MGRDPDSEESFNRSSRSRAIIEVDDMVKTYAQRRVAGAGASRRLAEVQQGEMVAIMGASGCGKTTLLNCISGLDDFDSGSVRIDGVGPRDA